MNAPRGATAGMTPWSAQDDALLRQAYLAGGIYRAAEALPRRTQGSIFHRAQRLGLKVRRRWTDLDDARLRHLWDSGVRLREIAKSLNRTPITTYWRAQKIGLQLGCPPGFEYLSAAATRSGYTTSQLRPILRWAGVRIQMATARPVRAVRRFHFVDPFDVDEALAQWHKTEPLETAARRVGVCGETLRRWLSAVGVEDEGRAFRCHWRVKTVDVARAVAAVRGEAREAA